MAKTNLAEFQARIYEADMVDIVAGFAYDVTLDVRFRKKCAESVVDRARGRVIQTTRSIIETASPASDDPEKAIEAARVSVARMRELQQCLASGRPREAWPEHIRAMVDEPAFTEGDDAV